MNIKKIYQKTRSHKQFLSYLNLVHLTILLYLKKLRKNQENQKELYDDVLQNYQTTKYYQKNVKVEM